MAGWTTMTDIREPPSPSPARLVAFSIGTPLLLGLLIFIPAGTWRWSPGWALLLVLVLGSVGSALVLKRLNPVIFSARSRFQPGTERWDLVLVAVMLSAVAAILPLGAYGATHWERPMPLAVRIVGDLMVVAGIAGTAWAQALNAFFEPGVRLQRERGQHVVSGGPYGFVRHPGYVAALLMFIGMALALGSAWALLPAALASAVLVLRTRWEDDLLRRELPGYEDYAGRVRWRLLPGLW